MANQGGQSLASAVEQPLGPEHRRQQSPYLSAVDAAAYMDFPNTAAFYAYLYRHPRFPRLRKGRRLLFDPRVIDAVLRGEIKNPLRRSMRLVHAANSAAPFTRKEVSKS